jgi:hypothetical protein
MRTAAIPVLKPSVATSQVVLDVPTVAPATSGMAAAIDIIPEVMKPIVASTVALEACVATVIIKPAPNARAGRAVTP